MMMRARSLTREKQMTPSETHDVQMQSRTERNSGRAGNGLQR
jgi:hypothetical protein